MNQQNNRFNARLIPFDPVRVRFLLGGRHGDFKFLPPSSYAPCYEALLPKEKMKVEPVKEYKRDVDGVRDLLGTTRLTSQASYIPTPVETSQVNRRSDALRKPPTFLVFFTTLCAGFLRSGCCLTWRRFETSWRRISTSCGG